MSATKPLLLVMAIAVLSSTLVAMVTGGEPLSAFNDLGNPQNPIDMAVFVWDIVVGTIVFFVGAVSWSYLAAAGVASNFVVLLQTLTGGLLAWALIEKFW